MNLLLTSGGITNTSIYNTLTNMLPKPISECVALAIPTANYAQTGGFTNAKNFIEGNGVNLMCDLGWKSIGVMELTALPSIPRDIWLSQLEADLVNIHKHIARLLGYPYDTALQSLINL